MSTTRARKFGVIGVHPVITAAAALVVVAAVVTTGVIISRPGPVPVPAEVSAGADVVDAPIVPPTTIPSTTTTMAPEAPAGSGGAGPRTAGSGEESGVTISKDLRGNVTLNCPNGQVITLDHTPTADEMIQRCGIQTGTTFSGAGTSTANTTTTNQYSVTCFDGQVFWLDHPATNEEITQLCPATTTSPPPGNTKPPFPYASVTDDSVLLGDWTDLSSLVVHAEWVLTALDGSVEKITKDAKVADYPMNQTTKLSWSYTRQGVEFTFHLDITPMSDIYPPTGTVVYPTGHCAWTEYIY